ncbi:ArsB/NhaD family transporter, partial [Staphylococcus aureus]
MTFSVIVFFLLTLTFVLCQPNCLVIGFTSLIGAVVCIFTDVVCLTDFLVVTGLVCCATITFSGTMLIS